MPREAIVQGNGDEERKRDAALRPRWLREVIGQQAVAKRLAIAVNAAKKLKEPLAHILFDGPPGLGKTTFATVLPHELGTTIQMTSGPALSKPADMLPFLARFCSSTKFTACRGWSRNSSTRPWRTFASTLCWAKA